MKEKKLFYAITNVNSDLIEEARTAKLKHKNFRWQRLTAVAACAALIVGSLFLFPKNEDNSAVPLLEVVFPQAYAYDDYESRGKVRNENPVDDEFKTAVNLFSYETTVQVFAQNKGNVNYSPLSLYYATALSATGANGKTADEMLALLNMPDKDSLSTQCGNFYRRIYKGNEIGKIKIANSLWMENNIKWKNNFIKNAADNFYAHSFGVDFSDSDTGKVMGQWVADNTNGIITPSIEVLPNQIMSIINTVYFYDEWDNSFNSELTAVDSFTAGDGRQINCEFMNSEDYNGFFKGKGFTRATLGLKNADAMVFILPDEGVSPRELLSTPEKAADVFDNGEEYYGKITWKIPKFSFGSKLDLSDTLKALGVNSAFASDADFSGITDESAFIGKINQDTHIGIDEKGVEAAAFTEISLCGTGAPQAETEMILDRPFIYGVYADGALLFIGICENPNEK